MINQIRFLRLIRSSLCLGLFSLILTVAIPTIAQPPSNVNGIVEQTNSLNLIDRGLAAYEAGRYTEAVRIWQQAKQQFRRKGDRIYQSSILNYLALAYQQLGQLQLAQAYNAQSLRLLQQSKEGNLALLGQVLNTKGSIELASGKPEAALESWEQAAAYYHQAEDEIGVIGSTINQAQALQTLGYNRRAQQLLEQIRQQIQTTDPRLEVKLLHSLGTTLQTTGNLAQSQSVLKESLELAKQHNLPQETAAIVFSLGNTARLLKHNQEAIAFYQQAASLTTHPLTQVETQLNLLDLLIAGEQWQATESLLPQIKTNIAQLSTNRPSIYAKVNLAKSLIALHQHNFNSGEYTEEIELLQTTLRQAKQLNDLRAESSTLGTLAYVYEQKQQWSFAQKYTQQALDLAQMLDASDMAYQWQWQSGRIQMAQGDRKSAIAAYTSAVNHLQSVRNNLVAVNLEAQFTFRESVERVYRELVGLLLDDNPNQAQLQQAREAIEALQLAELENFFQQACLDAEPKQIDEIDPTAAVIYPIILGDWAKPTLRDRLAVILSLPDGSLDYYSSDLPEAEIENTIENLYQSLNPVFSNQQRLQLSQQVYNWLIKPAEADLNKHGIKTLAFVLDGSLRKLPMAALYDGNQYLIEKYNIALTPGLELLPSSGLEMGKIKAVIGGVSEFNQEFSSLPGVEREVTTIAAQLSSELLLNQDFTDDNLQKQLQQTDASIVHLATHGQFSSDLDNTFIVTWNNRVGVNQIDNILRSRTARQDKPIDLMVLSACQTATGDKRAALGMAGMAVRSGARSTLASLWSVKDESTTQLMNKFYSYLVQSESNVNKAEALRQAQLELINSTDFNHPFYWSAFVLVGNWL